MILFYFILSFSKGKEKGRGDPPCGYDFDREIFFFFSLSSFSPPTPPPASVPHSLRPCARQRQAGSNSARARMAKLARRGQQGL